MRLLNWYGGKHYITGWLLQYMPMEHRVYVEVFGGGGSLLFAKRPSLVEVFNDIDDEVYNIFSVMRDEEKVRRLVDLCEWTEYGRRIFEECRERLQTGRYRDDVERAWCFLVVNMQSRSSANRSWTWTRYSVRGMAMPVARWRRRIGDLWNVYERLKGVVIENDDFEAVIRRWDGEDTWFYCDPPYVPISRTELDVYRHEMSMEDHERFLDVVMGCRGKVMVSGYDNELYRRLDDAGWGRAEIDVPCWSSPTEWGGERPTRREVLWFNYTPITSDEQYSLFEDME